MNLLENFYPQSKVDVLAERILTDLNQKLDRTDVDINPEDDEHHIKEFAILPSPEQEDYGNRSPVVFVEDRMALESWCLPRVYRHAVWKLLLEREKWLETGQNKLLDQYSRIILLLCPDFSTAWNVRRQLILDKYLDPHNEMRLTRLIITHKPKSADLFTYRKWLLNYILVNQHDPMLTTFTDAMVNKEFKFCRRAADLYKQNYYAWDYARFVAMSTTTDTSKLANLLKELEVTDKWAESNYTDYSCLHYRQYLIRRIDGSRLDSDSNPKLVEQEIEFVEKLIERYGSNCSLETHRKFALEFKRSFNPWKFHQSDLLNQYGDHEARDYLSELESADSDIFERNCND